MILIFFGPIIEEGILKITHSHTKLSGLYKKIHAKTGADQGLRGASLQTTLMADLFLFLQAPWTLQKMKRSRGGREREEKSSEKIKTSKERDLSCQEEVSPFYRQRLGFFIQEKMAIITMPQTNFGYPKNIRKSSTIWRKILVSHIPKNSPRKMKKKPLWHQQLI